jgi:hypothetical protein
MKERKNKKKKERKKERRKKPFEHDIKKRNRGHKKFTREKFK